MEPDNDALEHLKALVAKHKVCWDVLPVQSVEIGSEPIQVGYEVDLTGVFNDPSRESLPLKEMVVEVLDVLRTISEDVAQHAADPETCRVRAFDEGLQASGKREFRAEARLKLALLDPRGFHVPVSAAQGDALVRVEARLKELGACKGRWTKD